MRKEPWPHQLQAIERLRESLQKGKKRIVLQAPTGAGKTVIASMIVEGALDKNKRVAFVVPMISLIDQTVQAFWHEDIRDVGVIQANHPMTNYSKPVQVASVQTLARRSLPDVDVVIVDECHQDFEIIKQWKQDKPDMPFIGLSATPWTKGMGKHWEELIVVETTQGLIDKGFLSKFKTFASYHPDLKGIKSVAGDYHEGQLSERLRGDNEMAASIVKTWLDKASDRPTLAFCIDRLHAQKVQADFEAAGVPCGYIDAFTTREERAQIRAAFHRGDLKVVSSVGTLTTGVDWDVRCILLCRPTKSEMLYVQIIGRGLRTAEGKEDCLILDFSDNTLRLGFVTDLIKDQLDMGTKDKKAEKKPPLPRSCKQCGFIKPVKHTGPCPSCGYHAKPVSNVREADGKLVEIGARIKGGKKSKKAKIEDKQEWYSGFLHIQQERGYSPKWAVAQYKQKFGVWPRGLHENPEYPQPEVTSYVRSRMIAWAKSRR